MANAFPDEVAFVLKTLREVFRTDQQERAPRMKALEDWIARQFAEHRVEPHSGRGQAISYRQNRWQKLTLFLRVPGAPIGNNIANVSSRRRSCIGRTRCSTGP